MLIKELPLLDRYISLMFSFKKKQQRKELLLLLLLLVR